MNNYMGDTRYEKVWEQMQLLSIEDVTSKRQAKNGTRVWKLPIKNKWNNGSFIEVASFKTGYIRNNNSCSTNYQLNKRCKSKPDYYKIERNGETLYRKFTTRTCKLIPIEIERLEYLISYCLKNYYIKHANFAADGEYVPKWYHEYKLKEANKPFDCGHYDRIRDLNSEIRDLKDKLNTREEMNNDLECANNRLLDKLQSIIRAARH